MDSNFSVDKRINSNLPKSADQRPRKYHLLSCIRIQIIVLVSGLFQSAQTVTKRRNTQIICFLRGKTRHPQGKDPIEKQKFEQHKKLRAKTRQFGTNNSSRHASHKKLLQKYIYIYMHFYKMWTSVNVEKKMYIPNVFCERM